METTIKIVTDMLVVVEYTSNVMKVLIEAIKSVQMEEDTVKLNSGTG